MSEIIPEKQKSTSKKAILISIIIGLLIISGFLLWFFLLRIDESELRNIEVQLEKDKEISKYIRNLTFSKNEDEKVVKLDGLKSYPYNLTGNYTVEFNKLGDNEKTEIIGKVKDYVDELIKCGNKKYCSTDEIFVFDAESNDSYSLDLYSDELIHNYYDENDEFQTETIGSLSNNDDYVESDSYNENESSLEIVEKNGEIEGDYIYVTGAVKNNSDLSYTFVEVKVTYFDDNGTILDTESTFVNSTDAILPNERKSFEIMTQMIGQSYSNYKLEVNDFNIE